KKEVNMQEEIKEYHSLEEIRSEIDKIDKELITLLAKRSKYVESISKFKKDEESVKAPSRVKNMIIQRKKWAYENNLDMIFIENLYKTITSYFIEKEMNKWLKENKFRIEDLKIVPAKKENLSDILNLQILCYQSEAINCNDFDIPPLNYKIQDIENEFNDKIFFIASFNDKLIGSIRGYQKDETLFIEKIIVHPDFQNLGIGKLLIKTIEDYFKDCKICELFTGSRSEKNLKLYNKLGYQIYKEEKINDYYGIVFLKKTKSV
ncbi:MAG TPA: GNAT family N-acetyltransferase, partial [Spirochaetota bacterium]|nr:GNAT family N-acetyltransferase [Spirochaetota bacterium]